jgi:AraC family transcriptional regulator
MRASLLSSTELDAVRVAVLEQFPPCDGYPRTVDGHLMLMHLSRPTRLRQRREGQLYEGMFSRGDLTLIPARCQTLCWTKEAVDLLQVEIDPAFASAAIESAMGQASLGPELPCLFRFDDAVCRELALSMLHEVEAQGTAARIYLESAATVLALRLHGLAGRALAPVPRGGLPDRVLARAKEFLHDEMARNPGVAELSRVVGMNVHHFSRMFKRSTGLTPHRYLNEVRLEHAKRLLANGATMIIDVALDTGFATPSQFTAFFRKHTGLTPSQYRRAIK